jgi:hypothetical protein
MSRYAVALPGVLPFLSGCSPGFSDAGVKKAEADVREMTCCQENLFAAFAAAPA